jgi:hypothetical protein
VVAAWDHRPVRVAITLGVPDADAYGIDRFSGMARRTWTLRHEQHGKVEVHSGLLPDDERSLAKRLAELFPDGVELTISAP